MLLKLKFKTTIGCKQCLQKGFGWKPGNSRRGSSAPRIYLPFLLLLLQMSCEVVAFRILCNAVFGDGYRCTVARKFGKIGEWSFSGCFLKSRLSKGAISISPFQKSFFQVMYNAGYIPLVCFKFGGIRRNSWKRSTITSVLLKLPQWNLHFKWMQVDCIHQRYI